MFILQASLLPFVCWLCSVVEPMSADVGFKGHTDLQVNFPAIPAATLWVVLNQTKVGTCGVSLCCSWTADSAPFSSFGDIISSWSSYFLEARISHHLLMMKRSNVELTKRWREQREMWESILSNEDRVVVLLSASLPGRSQGLTILFWKDTWLQMSLFTSLRLSFVPKHSSTSFSHLHQTLAQQA